MSASLSPSHDQDKLADDLFGGSWVSLDSSFFVAARSF